MKYYSTLLNFLVMKERHLIVRSRNTSCKELRSLMITKRVIYRMGSTTPTEAITKRKDYIEINSPEACSISGDKILMKKAFVENNVPTAEYFDITDVDDEDLHQQLFEHFTEWGKMIVKHKHSSKGNGIYFIDNEEKFWEFIENTQNLKNYIFEKYYTYSKEYRLHVNKYGCFYACRKMLKNDAEVRWHRHENNSVWILEENPMFDKPNNWDDIVKSCIDAMNAVELDVAAVDVKTQTNTQNPKYIILETNSAPALGNIGIEKYKQMLTDYIYEQE